MPPSASAGRAAPHDASFGIPRNPSLVVVARSAHRATSGVPSVHPHASSPAPVQPTLSTSTLVLRPFAAGDAPAVQALAGAAEVASTTLNVPHPYPDGAAEAWIATHGPAYGAGTLAPFAIVAADTGELVGAMSLAIRAVYARAELGYWIGVPFWNRGYATEAAEAMLRFGSGTSPSTGSTPSTSCATRRRDG